MGIRGFGGGVVALLMACYSSVRPPDDDPGDTIMDPCFSCEGDWNCTQEGQVMRCTQAHPELPDDDGSTWACEYAQGRIICAGQTTEHPLAGNSEGWDCYLDSMDVDWIVCTRETDEQDFPDSDREWDCAFHHEASMRACMSGGHSEGWSCEQQSNGQICTKDQPSRPDGDHWECYRVGNTDVCQGDHFPESDWHCDAVDDVVICETDWHCDAVDGVVICETEGDVPDGDHEWECMWGQGEDGVLVCEWLEPSEPIEPSCVCIAGAVRYCDEAQFCLWGQQRCEERNGRTNFSVCEETDIPLGCEPNGEYARSYNWNFAGGYWDGQVQDPDEDGWIEFAPDFWYNPAAQDCGMRIGFCVQDMWDFDHDGDIQESIGEDCADIEQCG